MCKPISKWRRAQSPADEDAGAASWAGHASSPANRACAQGANGAERRARRVDIWGGMDIRDIDGNRRWRVGRDGDGQVTAPCQAGVDSVDDGR